MRSLILQRAGWALVGLCVLPLIASASDSQPAVSEPERLEWLLATHDVRYAIHAPRAREDACGHSESEDAR